MAFEVKEISVVYATVWDGKTKHSESHPFKHYMCKCGQYELLWFFSKLNGQCKNCAWFNK